jgi:hypothetical protein
LIYHGAVSVYIALPPLPKALVHPATTAHLVHVAGVLNNCPDDLIVSNFVFVIDLVKSKSSVWLIRIPPSTPI